MFSDIKEEINKHLGSYVEHMEAVNLRDGLTSAVELSQVGNNFIQSNRLDNKLVANEPDKAAAVVVIAINIIHLCAIVFEPYLPATSKSILEQLNASFQNIPDRWTCDSIKPGHQINKAKYLFTQIPIEKEIEWKEMYGGSQEGRNLRIEEAAKKAEKKAAEKAKKNARKIAKQSQQDAEQNRKIEEEKVGGITDGYVLTPSTDPMKRSNKVGLSLKQMTFPSS